MHRLTAQGARCYTADPHCRRVDTRWCRRRAGGGGGAWGRRRSRRPRAAGGSLPLALDARVDRSTIVRQHEAARYLRETQDSRPSVGRATSTGSNCAWDARSRAVRWWPAATRAWDASATRILAWRAPSGGRGRPSPRAGRGTGRRITLHVSGRGPRRGPRPAAAAWGARVTRILAWRAPSGGRDGPRRGRARGEAADRTL